MNANKNKTDIQSRQEIEQDIYVTIDNIKSENSVKKSNGGVTDDEVKAAIDEVNPDCGTLDRG